MNYLISLAIGLGVGLLYGALDFRSPAPPAIALVGLLGMLAGESSGRWAASWWPAGSPETLLIIRWNPLMKALQFDKTGDLSALRYVEVATPVPGADEVLVEIKAAGLNPSDVKNVLGRFPTPRCRAYPVATLPASSLKARRRWWVNTSGAPVANWVFADGSHAQFVKLPANGVALKPTHLSFARPPAWVCPTPRHGMHWSAAW
jgi:XapX domain-containing protein